MKKIQVARLLAYVTGMVNQQMLQQNEYLVADQQRSTLAEIGSNSGRRALR